MPKEKAEEIYNRFYLANKNPNDILKIKSKEISKTNALICVDELLKVCDFKLRSFYQKVKQEILKL